MCVEKLIKVRHNKALDVVVVATYPPILDTLHSRRHSSKNPELVTMKMELSALDISHFQAKFLHQIIVQKIGSWQRVVRVDQSCKWSAFASENKFLIC